MTEPLPWTGAIRSIQEIEEQKPAMDEWFGERKKESLARMRVLKLQNAKVGTKNVTGKN